MPFVRLPDYVLYIELLSQARIKLPDANIDFGAQPLQRLDPLQQLASQCVHCG